VNAPIYVMQSSGGMISAEEAAEVPVEIVECGPAAGVVGASYLAEQLSISNIVTLDLGGTTTKASVVENGQYTRSAEYEVGAGIHRASRLHKGKGYVLRIPSIDIAEIGAGGGSLVWMDQGGLMNVGPKRAGASPGPIRCERGGAGALHGAAVARSMGMKEVIIAPLAGVFSAYGLLCADLQRIYVNAFDAMLDGSSVAGANQVLCKMTREAIKIAQDHGYSPDRIRIQKYVDLRYRRQQSELTLPLPREAIQETDLPSLQEAFNREYEKTFG